MWEHTGGLQACEQLHTCHLGVLRPWPPCVTCADAEAAATRNEVGQERSCEFLLIDALGFWQLLASVL